MVLEAIKYSPKRRRKVAAGVALLEAVSKPDYFVRFALFPTGGVDLTSK